MSQKPGMQRAAAEKVVKEIRRSTRKQHSAEEKIRIVLAGLRGEDSIAEHCRREGIAQRACTTAGRRSSSRRASGAWRATPPGRRPAPR
jgi:transposase-like protein